RGHGPRARANHRRVRAGCDPLRVADGPASVPGGDGGGDGAASDLPRTGAAVADESECAARPGDDLPEVSAQRSAAALRHGGGPGGRPPAVPAGRAHPGADCAPACSPPAVVAATPAPFRAAGSLPPAGVVSGWRGAVASPFAPSTA